MANNPRVIGSVEDSNNTTIALTGNRDVLIRYHSYATCTLGALPTAPGASMNEDMYIIRNGDWTGYGTTHTFPLVENNVFTFSAEDSLGNIGTDTVTATMIPYEKLTCNIGNNRPDGEGKMALSCTGVFFNGSFGARNNTLTVQCRYKPHGGSYSAWMNMSVTLSASTYYATANLTGLNYQNSYTFEIMATDLLESIIATSTGVRSTPVFHWGETDFDFEVPVSMNAGADVTGDLDVDGDLDVSGDLTVGGKALQLPEYGTWTPELSFGAVSSYTSRNGWYCKVGNIMTVGFYIKAICNGGYHTEDIVISGLDSRFLSSGKASGGGMCSGAYVRGGHNFQCFAIEDLSANITTRVQECNSTVDDILGTAANGCKYPLYGGEITLGGTICFMTWA